MDNKKQSGAYVIYITSMLIFGTIGVFRRYIPVSSGMLAFMRGVIGAAFLCAFVKLRGRKLRNGIGRRNALLLMLSGFLIGINWMLLFEAYNYTGVATVTLCYYMQPTIVILVSPILLKEQLTPKKLLCAITAVIGMVFVSGILSGGELPRNNMIGILYGLAAAVLYASVVILNKKIDVSDSYEKTIIQLISAAVIMIPYLFLTEKNGFILPDTRAIIMIVVVGVIHTGLAYALYFAGIAGMKAQSAAVLSYIDPVSALILSVLILKENVTALGIVGAVLIVGSALVSELRNPEK